MKKDLTVRYGLHMLCYWASLGGLVNFATTFLLEKGFSPAQIGILLAAGNFGSFVTQPVMAARADRVGKQVLPAMLMGSFGVIIACLAAIALFDLPMPLLGGLFLVAYLLFDAVFPLNNSVCVSYNQSGWTLNYGLGRAVGSLSCSLSSLCMGRLIRRFGGDCMIWGVAAMLTLGVMVISGYPKLDRETRSVQQSPTGQGCSIAAFFLRYRWYCCSMVGILLMAAVYMMIDNYYIKILERLGGDSSHVGVALAIATASATPVFVFFDQIRKRISDFWILKIAGLSFLAKATLLLFAPNIPSVYAIQLLQTTSYAFYSSVQLYYAARKVTPADMVKGQAYPTAAYALGAGLGSMLGGWLMQHCGVTALLLAAVAIAAAATAILFATVNKRDKWMEGSAACEDH